MLKRPGLPSWNSFSPKLPCAVFPPLETCHIHEGHKQGSHKQAVCPNDLLPRDDNYPTATPDESSRTLLSAQETWEPWPSCCWKLWFEDAACQTSSCCASTPSYGSALIPVAFRSLAKRTPDCSWLQRYQDLSPRRSWCCTKALPYRVLRLHATAPPHGAHMRDYFCIARCPYAAHQALRSVSSVPAPAMKNGPFHPKPLGLPRPQNDYWGSKTTGWAWYGLMVRLPKPYRVTSVSHQKMILEFSLQLGGYTWIRSKCQENIQNILVQQA